MLNATVISVALLTTSAVAEQSMSVTVPMKMSDYGHVYVDAKLNNLPAHPMILDTAADNGVIPNSIFKDLALPKERLFEKKVSGGFSTSILTHAEVKQTEVGAVSSSNLTFIVQDMTVLKTKQGKVPGILGYHFMKSQCTKFDFGNKEVSFYPKKCPKQVTTNLNSADFWVEGNLIKLNVDFDGQTVEAFLDTGASANIMNTHLFDKLNIEKEEVVEGKGLHGKKTSAKKLGDVRYQLGGHTITSQKTALIDMPVFKELGYEDKPLLLIGLPDFSDDTLIVDYGAQKIYF